MIHSQKTKQLGRERNVRNALLKTMAVSLIKEGKIITTETKAKVLKPQVEKMITKAKKADFNTQKFLQAKLGVATAGILLKTLAPKYKDRHGGYLRIAKLGDRKSDGAKRVQLEFV